jgi:ribosomal protein L24E
LLLGNEKEFYLRARKALIAATTSGALLATTVLLSTPAAYASTNPKPAFATTTQTTSSSTGGYLAIGSSGQVTAGGGATAYGSASSTSKIVGGAPTVDGGGYYLVAADGSVYTFGNAKFYGSTFSDGITGLGGKHPLNAPIVGMAVVPGGYYLVAADGGVFDFGAAKFLGSTYSYGITGLSGSKPLNAPIVGIVPTPSGNGYWLVAKDGGIFDFGSAPFLGSTYTYGITGLSGKRPLNAPIVGAIASPSGQGYYMVAADGGVFNFGDAKFTGSTYDLGYTGLGGKNPLPAQVSSLMANPGGSGYYAICANGKILAIGGAAPLPAIQHIRGPIVAVIPPKAVGLAHKTQKQTPTPQPSPSPTPQPSPSPSPSPSPTPTPPALSITTSSVTISPSGAYGLSATGGNGSYTWSEGASSSTTDITVSSSGALAFALNTSGVFPGTHTIPVTVTSDGESASANISVTVTPYTLSNSSTTVYTGTNNSVQLSLSSAGNPPPSSYIGFKAEGTTWATDGLSLSSTGVITGTPSSSFATGTPLKVGIMFEDAAGTGKLLLETVDLPVTETTATPPTITSTSVSMFPGGTAQLGASGGDNSYTWSATGLPTGLSLSSAGVLSADSSTVDSSTFTSPASFTAKVTSGGTSTTATMSLTITPPALKTSTFDVSGSSISSQLEVPTADGSGYTFAESTTAGTAWPSTLSMSSTGLVTGSLSASVSGVDVEVLYDSEKVATLPVSFTVASSTGPTVTSSFTYNWAGMVANTASNTDAISQASGTYVVPTLASTQSSLCSEYAAYYGCTVANWVGIDGQSSQQLIQAGTNSTPGHSIQAWVEFITPTNLAPETDVTLTNSSGSAIIINPGDQISVSITKNSSQNWTITLTDLTQNASYSTTQNFEASIYGTLLGTGQTGESAEWIDEAPEYSAASGSPLAGLCAITPATPNTTSAPCTVFSIMPQISAGGQFLSQSLTSTSLSSALADSQYGTSMSGYNLTAAGDGLLTPTGYSSNFTLNGFGFTQNGGGTPTSGVDVTESTPSVASRVQ